MTDITQLTTIQLAALVGRGELTAMAVVEAALARISVRDPDIKAWAHVDREGALAAARRADELKLAGRPTGPLHGVPVGVKDIIDTADQPTGCGSPLFKGHRPEADATVIERLKRAGAIILGKTVTTELATIAPAETRNPHNLAHTPGGSSSGSAAAVADMMVPVALATQTGGSVIRPASFCGIYGIKPTFGLIPRTGVLSQSPSLDTVGVYGRAIEDLALMLDVLAGFDGGDPQSRRSAHPGHLATTTEPWDVKPVFAFLKTPAWAKADPVTREAFGELVGMLGPQVEETSLDLTLEAALEAQAIINDVELAGRYGPWFDKRPDAVSARVGEQIERGRKIPATAYFAALEARTRVTAAVEQLMFNYNAILTPAALGPAPQGLGSTGDPAFNRIWTFTGSPAVTLPLLADEHAMPMGVQLVGAIGDDARLLRTARQLVRLVAEDAN